MNITILGSYITSFGELWDKSLEALMREATVEALKDAAIKKRQIDAIFVANKAGGSFNSQRHLGALASGFFKHYPPALRVEAACASGGLAVLQAIMALEAGRYETVLVLGVEKMTDVSAGKTTEILASAADISCEYGSTFPGLYALLAKAHMREFGTTREMLSSVAVKNHAHALNNPKAQFHKKFNLEQVSQSSLVADPLRLLDCSPISDGAAAVILTSKKTKGVKIIASAQAQDSLSLAGRASLLELAATKKAAKLAFAQAKLTPKQIQAAEVHDCFTIAEILAVEDLGFFKKGQAGPAIFAGKTQAGQKLVINPSGGLKACGHPVGATGVKQLAFLNKYLVSKNLRYGLTHNVGGSGATAVVHILKHD